LRGFLFGACMFHEAHLKFLFCMMLVFLMVLLILIIVDILCMTKVTVCEVRKCPLAILSRHVMVHDDIQHIQHYELLIMT
jgi:hypothetical protein